MNDKTIPMADTNETQTLERQEEAPVTEAELEKVTGGGGRYQGAGTGQTAEEFARNAPPI